MKKVIIASCLSLSILGISAAPIMAKAEELPEESKLTEITPYVNWSGQAYLTTAAYSNVTSSNNFFSDSPTVTNASGNPGAIKVKVVNANGEQVGKVKEIGKGKSVKLDSVPWNSGDYTIKAMALDKNGQYTISVD